MAINSMWPIAPFPTPASEQPCTRLLLQYPQLPPLPFHNEGNFPVLPLPSTLSALLPLKYSRKWSISQVNSLYEAARNYCHSTGKIVDMLTLEDYTFLAQKFHKTPEDCLKKVREVLISGSAKSGVWCKAEDELLVSLLSEGVRWKKIAEQLNSQIHAGLKIRNTKHAKERWNNHLDPDVRRGSWSLEEDFQLLTLHQTHKNQWSLIGEKLRFRTGTAVKNRVKSLLKQHQQRGTTSNRSDFSEQLITRMLSESPF